MIRKFIIWGCGIRGKQLALELGKTYVEAIVDSNPNVHGTFVDGIKVISPNELYAGLYKQYPIIVTPKGHEEKIINELRIRGFCLIYDYNKDFLMLEYYVVQTRLERIIDLRGNNIYIFGLNSLAWAICIWLSTMGKRGIIVDSKSDDATVECLTSNGIIYKSNVPLYDKKDGWYVTDHSLKDNPDVINHAINLFDIETRKDLTTNTEIENFKNVHKGKRGFIVATGPSLRMDDLEMLRRNHEICISVNGIVNAIDNTSWRPDYYAVSDPLAWKLYKDKCEKLEAKAYFISDISWDFIDYYIKDNFYKWHFMRQEILPEQKETPDISEDFAEGAFFGATVAYEAGVQLALYMGLSEIYLLGADTPNGGATMHFDDVDNPNRERSTLAQNYLRIVKAYESARQLAERRNVKIYNATRGGDLEVFERVNFDDLFRSK